jgi:hypothetical protein
MKRYARFLVPVLMMTGFAVAQGQSPIRFNVHLSPQFNWLSSSDQDKIDPDGSNFHLHAGIQMDYFFAKNYAFIIGFGINNLGGKLAYKDSVTYKGDGQDVVVPPDSRVKMNLQYLDVPVGLKLKTEELGYGTFFLQLGLNPMFNVNAHITSDELGYDKKSIKESVNLFALGYHVGAGIEYRLGGNTALIGGVRWTSGLTNVTENDGSTITTNAISIDLGILF